MCVSSLHFKSHSDSMAAHGILIGRSAIMFPSASAFPTNPHALLRPSHWPVAFWGGHHQASPASHPTNLPSYSHSTLISHAQATVSLFPLPLLFFSAVRHPHKPAKLFSARVSRSGACVLSCHGPYLATLALPPAATRAAPALPSIPLISTQLTGHICRSNL